MSSAENTTFVDFYEVLGVQPNAEMSEIRRAYILKAKEHHPDAGGSVEMMRKLNTAYKTLKDSTAKAAYDMLHGFHTGTTTPSDYRYNDGREVRDVSDMDDQEIDAFLDSLLAEYRNGPSKEKQSITERLKNYLKKI
jgi:curved DNA-binding protein CbpA